ncbi:hypothetical protein [Methylobacterium sp. J-068]|uniref:hypothetical protein n=1 Tax=Methylobacterium sp. J-068 TaxID=2836649 RepID=UPI001FB8D663|nr:hypothetical protein [Methylobacterium sp. J-068]MCJ2036110.1 hypothetical protein [Methylobacterium sp. J-068]
MTRTSIGAGILVLLLAVSPVRAQVVDGSDQAIGADRAAGVIALTGRGLRTPGTARYGRLRAGRAGAVCGEVETTNRMGDPVGPRHFVADVEAGIAGILPDGPELRNPATPQDYAAMQRILALYAANCAL